MVSDSPRQRSRKRNLFAFVVENLGTRIIRGELNLLPQAQFNAELFEIRRMIEPQAAGLAAKRGSRREIAAIGHAFAAMSEAARLGTSGIEADLLFHRAILVASHNALLLQMGNLIAVGLTIAHRVLAESFVVFLPMHEAVYDTIAKRDGDRARKPMHELLSQTQHFMNRHAQALARNL
jgi:DNA-binding FadR family transcriptional regulator